MQVKPMKFLLNDTEAELLLQFESSPSLEGLAQAVGRDMTVVSKQLKRIAEKAEVLMKVSGRWRLTEKGKSFNQATRDFLRAQNAVLSEKYHLRIGTNREFAARILSKNITSLQKYLESATLEVRALERGTESALLAGEIDIAFDCGKPYSPEIKYNQIKKEPIVAVAAPTFIKKFGEVENVNELLRLPHIFCERLKIDRITYVNSNVENIVVHTNDIASARTMATEGIGWALLPEYAVHTEIKKNLLKEIFKQKFDQEKYGVWRLRTRHHIQNDFELACQWLTDLDF